jgi:hypothetical protein
MVEAKLNRFAYAFGAKLYEFEGRIPIDLL